MSAGGMERRQDAVEPDRSVAAGIDDADAERADAYVLIGSLLAGPPSADLLALLGELEGDDSETGIAVTTLATAARGISIDVLHDEYGDLFVGIDPEHVITPYASYYLTGHMYGATLVDLRADMAKLGIARDPEVREPEDHIAALCQMMAGLILGRFGGGPASLAVQKAFFEAHLAGWVGAYADRLAGNEKSAFYVAAGRFVGLFLRGEGRRFGLRV